MKMGGILARIDRNRLSFPESNQEEVEFSQVSSEALRIRVQFLTERKDFTQIGLLNSAGLDIDPKRFSEWLSKSSNWRKLNLSQQNTLKRYLVTNKLWQTNSFNSLSKAIIDDNVYHSLIDFLDVKRGTEENIKHRASGLYRLYRPSLLIPKQFVLGALLIWTDMTTNAVRTFELQKFSGSDGSNPKTEQYYGYLIRKSKKYTIIARDQNFTALQTTLLPDFFIENEKITMFIGVTMGLFGARPYTMRFFAERYYGDADDLEAELDLKEDIPLIAKAALSGGIENKGITVY